MKIEVGQDGRTRYDGKTLAEMPFVKSFPLSVTALEEAELEPVLKDYRYGVKILLDEILRRKRSKKPETKKKGS